MAKNQGVEVGDVAKSGTFQLLHLLSDKKLSNRVNVILKKLWTFMKMMCNE